MIIRVVAISVSRMPARRLHELFNAQCLTFALARPGQQEWRHNAAPGRPAIYLDCATRL